MEGGAPVLIHGPCSLVGISAAGCQSDLRFAKAAAGAVWVSQW
jgi:hypothetical protein